MKKKSFRAVARAAAKKNADRKISRKARKPRGKKMVGGESVYDAFKTELNTNKHIFLDHLRLYYDQPDQKKFGVVNFASIDHKVKGIKRHVTKEDIEIFNKIGPTLIKDIYIETNESGVPQMKFQDDELGNMATPIEEIRNIWRETYTEKQYKEWNVFKEKIKNDEEIKKKLKDIGYQIIKKLKDDSDKDKFYNFLQRGNVGIMDEDNNFTDQFLQLVFNGLTTSNKKDINNEKVFSSVISGFNTQPNGGFNPKSFDWFESEIKNLLNEAFNEKEVDFLFVVEGPKEDSWLYNMLNNDEYIYKKNDEFGVILKNNDKVDVPQVEEMNEMNGGKYIKIEIHGKTYLLVHAPSKTDKNNSDVSPMSFLKAINEINGINDVDFILGDFNLTTDKVKGGKGLNDSSYNLNNFELLNQELYNSDSNVIKIIKGRAWNNPLLNNQVDKGEKEQKEYTDGMGIFRKEPQSVKITLGDGDISDRLKLLPPALATLGTCINDLHLCFKSNNELKGSLTINIPAANEMTGGANQEITSVAEQLVNAIIDAAHKAEPHKAEPHPQGDENQKPQLINPKEYVKEKLGYDSIFDLLKKFNQYPDDTTKENLLHKRFEISDNYYDLEKSEKRGVEIKNEEIIEYNNKVIAFFEEVEKFLKNKKTDTETHSQPTTATT